MKNSISIKKISFFIIMLAIGWVLPLITMQIPDIGNMLCPMHIPVMICGLILGPWYGILLGFSLPLTRTLIFGMPVLFPSSISMAFELATYGLVSGLLYYYLNKINHKKLYLNLYVTLISSMIIGRIIYGIVRYLCSLFMEHRFTLNLFLTDSVLNSWPGVLIQLAMIPVLIVTVSKTHYVKEIKF